MFENILKFFKKFSKENNKDSKDTAKERLHLVLMQDRANVSADFLEMMKQEIIEVIKKYIDVDDIVDLLSIDLIGVVPDDEYIITQTNKGEPVIQNRKAPSGKAYLEIAKRVLGEKIEVTIPGREKGFFSKIKGIFKK